MSAQRLRERVLATIAEAAALYWDRFALGLNDVARGLDRLRVTNRNLGERLMTAFDTLNAAVGVAVSNMTAAKERMDSAETSMTSAKDVMLAAAATIRDRVVDPALIDMANQLTAAAEGVAKESGELGAAAADMGSAVSAVSDAMTGNAPAPVEPAPAPVEDGVPVVETPAEEPVVEAPAEEAPVEEKPTE